MSVAYVWTFMVFLIVILMQLFKHQRRTMEKEAAAEAEARRKMAEEQQQQQQQFYYYYQQQQPSYNDHYRSRQAEAPFAAGPSHSHHSTHYAEVVITVVIIRTEIQIFSKKYKLENILEQKKSIKNMFIFLI